MKKYLQTLLLITLVGSFILPSLSFAQSCPPGTYYNPSNGACVSITTGNSTPQSSSPGARIVSFATGAVVSGVMDAFGVAAIAVLNLASWITGLAGLILNYTVWYTVLNMSALLEQGNVINDAWSTLRDVANMVFIFILLYAAIKTILGMGDGTQKLIRNVIIVAILINFSLFFTKLIIDAANVLAIFFYDAIAPGALAAGETGFNTTGISVNLMQALGLQGIWSSPLNYNGEGEQMLIIGIMGTILCLIAAFVFFAMAIMFVIRLVVLIFVLILSPIAFIGSVLPEIKSKVTNKWTDALLGQAFFAPIYFLLAWIVVKVAQGLLGSIAPSTQFGSAATLSNTLTTQSQTTTTIGLILNFIIVIALLIASLIISKDWANKAGGAVSSMTKWALGAAGGATLGGAAWATRNTIGRAGVAMSESETLKKARQWSDKRGGALGFVGGLTSRGLMSGGKKLGGSSYDIRGTGLGGTLEAGKAGGKGGFAQYRKDAAKSEEEFAKSLATSDEVRVKARMERDRLAREAPGSEEFLAAQRRVDELEGLNKDQKKERKAEVKERFDNALKGDTDIKRHQELEEIAKKAEADAKKREEDMVENDPDFQREKLLEEEVKKIETEMKAAIIPELKQQKVEELEAKKQELALARGANQTKRDLINEEVKLMREQVEARKQEAEEAKPAAEARRKALDDASKAEIASIDKFKSLGDQRKEDFTTALEKSPWGIIRGYNYTAAAQIRKGKKSAKELIDEALKDTGEKSEEKEEEKPAGGGGTPPTT